MAKTQQSILVLRLRDSAPLFVIDPKYYPLPLPALRLRYTDEQMTDDVCLARDWLGDPEYMRDHVLERAKETHPEAKFVRYLIEITEE